MKYSIKTNGGTTLRLGMPVTALKAEFYKMGFDPVHNAMMASGSAVSVKGQYVKIVKTT